MSRQNKTRREKSVGVEDIISKILEIKELELADFALKCEIAPDTLRQAIRRDKLSRDIVTKIHGKYGVRKKYLTDGQEPIFEENHTPVQKTSDLDRKMTEVKDKEIEILREQVDFYREKAESLKDTVKELRETIRQLRSS